MTGKLTAVTALAALALGATSASASYRGAPVKVADAPWIASLTAFGPGLKPDVKRLGKPGWRSACSAAVIGPKLVLTASHCVDDHDLTRIGVSVGSDNLLASAGHVVPIARVWSPILHGGEQPGRDTAIVETTEPLGVPVLPLATERPRAGEKVSSFGFGDDRAGNAGDVPRPFLRRLDSVVSARCNVTKDPDAICTVASNGGVMGSGDSGGPLVVWRNGSPALAGDASSIGGRVNVYADAVARRDFIAAPPASALVPTLTAPLRIKGSVRPGGRVTCAATFVPKPRRLTYEWYVGSISFGKVKYVPNPSGGKPLPYRDIRPPFSHKRSIVLPRSARGKRVSCIVKAISGPNFQTQSEKVIARLRGR